MNRLDTSTPLAAASDYVLELAQPDAPTIRLCVSCKSGGEMRPLFDFLENLALRGLIARGGGSRERWAEMTPMLDSGLVSTVDAAADNGGGHLQRNTGEASAEEDVDPFDDNDYPVDSRLLKHFSIVHGEMVVTAAGNDENKASDAGAGEDV